MRLFQQYGFVGLFRVASELMKTGTDAAARGGAAGQENFEQVLNSLQAWLRDAQVIKSVSDPVVAERFLVNADLRPELEVYAKQASLSGLAEASNKVQLAYSYANRQTDKNYVLETLLLHIGRAMK